MTDDEGNLVWFGNYTGWGRLKEESKVTDSAYQPEVGRFVNQDPIGLWGGTNFYQFSMNALGGVDPLGLTRKPISRRIRR